MQCIKNGTLAKNSRKLSNITAGSCTHAVAVEELNRDEGYNLKYIDIELMNTETEPYCDVGKMRVESIVKNMSWYKILK